MLELPEDKVFSPGLCPGLQEEVDHQGFQVKVLNRTSNVRLIGKIAQLFLMGHPSPHTVYRKDQDNGT